MKLKNIFLMTFLFFTVSAIALAQGGPQKGRFDFEKLAREKAVFLKTEMTLTDAEAKAFLPMESEYMKKKIMINRDARVQTRELKKKDNKTDADYKKITQINLDAETKEAALTKEYYEKFATVLSSQKIERYRKADQKYMQILLERRKQCKEETDRD